MVTFCLPWRYGKRKPRCPARPQAPLPRVRARVDPAERNSAKALPQLSYPLLVAATRQREYGQKAGLEEARGWTMWRGRQAPRA
jgi:hypothetical protein